MNSFLFSAHYSCYGQHSTYRRNAGSVVGQRLRRWLTAEETLYEGVLADELLASGDCWIIGNVPFVIGRRVDVSILSGCWSSLVFSLWLLTIVFRALTSLVYRVAAHPLTTQDLTNQSLPSPWTLSLCRLYQSLTGCGDSLVSLIQGGRTDKWNEMNGVLGYLRAHIG